MRTILVALIFVSIGFFLTTSIYSSVEAAVTLGSWQQTASFSGRGHPHPSFAVNGKYYVHTNDSRTVYFGTPDSSGNIASWTEAWGDHGGIHGYNSIVVDGTPFHFRNGHIAKYKMQSDGTIDDVELLEPSGDLEAAFDGRLYVWDSSVYIKLTTGKYVYHLGGFSCPGHGCPVSYRYDGAIFFSNVPIGSTFQNTGKEHPDYGQSASQSDGIGISAAYVPNGSSNYGFIYTTRNMNDRLWKIRVNSDGALGDWSQVGTLPSGDDNRGDLFVIGNTMFSVRGSKVFSAELDPSNGNIGSWSDNPPDLPSKQIDVHWGGELAGSSWAVIGNYVYLTGPNNVYYAALNGGGGGITPTTAPSTVPDCTSLTGPTTLTIGGTGTYSLQATGGADGAPVTVVALSSYQGSCGIQEQHEQRSVAGPDTYTFDWSSSQTGEHVLYGRVWNDGIAECRSDCVDEPPRYPCNGSASCKLTVNVVPQGTIITPDPTNTPTPGPANCLDRIFLGDLNCDQETTMADFDYWVDLFMGVASDTPLAQFEYFRRAHFQ